MSQPSLERKRRIVRAVNVCIDRGLISQEPGGRRNGVQQELADYFGVTRYWIWWITREVRADRAR